MNQQPLSLARILEESGIRHRPGAMGFTEALADALDWIVLPEGFDRKRLLASLVERERQVSCVVGKGVALPHSRHPMLSSLSEPSVSLHFHAQAITWPAPNAHAVKAFFLILCPTAQIHLRLVAALSRVLRTPEFERLIPIQASAQEIVLGCRQIEQRYPHWF